MDENQASVVRQVLRSYRHLMTESERRADRAFTYSERLRTSADPPARAEAEAGLAQAMTDRTAEELFNKGRERFLEDLVRRILDEHAHVLPKCSQCGQPLRQPHPKNCFDCR